MGFGLVLYCVGLPLVLLGAGLARINLLSLVYFIGFLTNLGAYAKTLSWYLAIMSGLALIGHAVFQTVMAVSSDYGRELLPDNATSTEVVEFLGFHRIADVGDGFRTILPDALVFAISLVAVILFQKRKVFLPLTEAEAEKTNFKLPFLHAYACILFIFFSGVATPSILQFVYFFVLILALLVKSLGHKPMALVMKWLFYPLFVYLTLHMMFIYIYQIKWIHEAIAPEVAAPLGLVFYVNFRAEMSSVTMLISWIAMIILFALLSVQQKYFALKSRLKVIGAGKFNPELRKGLLEDDKKDNPINKGDGAAIGKSKFRTITLKTGFVFSLLSLLFAALFVPSILGAFLLAFVCVATLVPERILHRGRVFAGIMVYLYAVLIAQYIYNVPFGFPTSETLTDVGFSQYKELFWLRHGALCLVAFVLALYWNYADAALSAPVRSVSKDLILDREEPSVVEDESSRRSRDGLRQRRKSVVVPSASSSSLLSSKSNPEIQPAKKTVFQRIAGWFKSIRDSPRWAKFKSVLAVLGWWFLRQSYLLSLAGLYIAGLTQVNLLNTGYMLIFIVFLISPNVAKKSWLLLVVYTETVVMLVYLWDALSWWTKPENNPAIDAHRDFVENVMGLRVYNDPVALFASGMLRHLVVMLFSVVQWKVNNITDEQKKNAKHRSTNIPRWMRAADTWWRTNWPQYGLILVYMTFIIVTLVDELTLPNLLYMVFYFFCIMVHVLSSNALKHLKRIWLSIVVISGVILIARYAYQFTDISDWVITWWPNNYNLFFSPEDFGLSVFPEGSLFVRLLGNTFVLLVTVIQARSFFQGSGKKKADEEAGTQENGANGEKGEGDEEEKDTLQRDWPNLYAFLQFIKRLLMLHSFKVTIIAIFLLSLAPVCGLHSPYVLILLFSFLSENGTDLLGVPILIYTGLVCLAQLVFQFNWTQSLVPLDLMKWVGFYVATNSDQRWYLIQGYLWVSALLVIQRYSRRAKDNWYKEQYNIAVAKRKNPNKPVKVPELKLFIYPREFQSQKRFTVGQVINASKWYLSNILSIHSYQAFVLALLILIFVRHKFALAIVYLLILGLSVITKEKWWRKSSIPLRLFTAWVGIAILLQYLLKLGLPTGMDTPWKTWTWPSSWSSDTPDWLGINIQSPWVLVADWFALLLISRVALVHLRELRVSPYWREIIITPITYDDFKKPRVWTNSLRYYAYRFSVFWILIFVFAAGTVQPDILSFGYVIFALWFLFRDSEIYRRRNKLWRAARIYNYIILFARIFYQAPFIPAGGNDEPNNFGQIIGLRKIDEAKDLLFDIIIFVLLSVQKNMFERKEFDLVVRYMLDEEDKGVRIAHQRFQEWKKERKKQLDKIANEKLRRKQQLELLKAARQRQQKIWMTMGSQSKGMTMQPGFAPPGPAHSMPTSYDIDPRMATVSTTEDLKRLQEAGALEVEEDEESNTLRMKLKPSFYGGFGTQGPNIPIPGTERDFVPATPDVLVMEQDDDEGEEIKIPESKDTDDSPSDNPEEEGEAEVQRKKKCCSCRTPRFILRASDSVINFLDRHTYSSLWEVPGGRPRKIWTGVYKVYQKYSYVLCYLAFMINAVVNADLLSLFYPISMFIYALLEIPRPHKLYWNIVFVYTVLTILVKFIFQISLFCMCTLITDGRAESWSFYPYCDPGPQYLHPAPGYCAPAADKQTSFQMSYPQIIGIYKFEHAFVVATLPDLVVLIAVFMHRYWLKKHGYWAFVKRYTYAVDDEQMKKQMLQETRHYERILLKQQKKREKWSEIEASHRLLRLQKAQKRLRSGNESQQEAAFLEREQDDLNVVVVENPVFGNAFADIDFDDDEFIEKSLLPGSVSPAPSIPLHDTPTLVPIQQQIVEIDEDEDDEARRKRKKEKKKKQKKREKEKKDAPPVQPDEEEGPTGDAIRRLKSERRKSRLLVIMSPKARRELEEQEEEEALRKKKKKHTEKRKKKEEEREKRRTKRLSAEYRVPEAEGESDDDERPPARDSTQPQVPFTEVSEDDVVDVDISAVAATSNTIFSDITAESTFRDATFDLDDIDDDEDEEEDQAVVRRFKGFGRELLIFYRNVVDPKAGKDFFVAMWFIEMVCFFFIMFFPTQFIGGVNASFASFLASGRSIPTAYVITLLVQFIFIILERVIYLFRAIRVKLIYHYALVIFYHYWLWFFLPALNNNYFWYFPGLVVFYLLKFAYLFFSGLQISNGYPLFVQGQYLTDTKNPGMIRWLVYTGYRAIPFVYELRTILDWTITTTTLTFYEWLKLEDVYAQLFITKCRIAMDHEWRREPGDKTAWYNKLLIGGLVFILLVGVIWFPLLALMQGSPGNDINNVVAADMKISFQAYGTSIFVSLSQNITQEPVPMSIFNPIRFLHPWISPDDQKIMQIIEFTEFSDTVWVVSPPARLALLNALQNNLTVSVVASLTFTRNKAPDNINFGMTYTSPQVNLSPNASAILYSALVDPGPTRDIVVPAFIPRFYRIPIVPPIDIPQQPNHPIDISLRLDSVLVNDSLGNATDIRIVDYWRARQDPITNNPGEPFTSNKITVVTFSSEVPLSFVQSFATIGLIGLYVGVVLAVGRFLRLSITDLALRIVLEDMPECDELLSYCEDIFLARQDGDLKLEEDLFRELIELYRSPERLILRTLPKGPRFAGHKKSKKDKSDKSSSSDSESDDDSKLKKE